MIVLSVDPGLYKFGIAVMEYNGMYNLKYSRGYSLSNKHQILKFREIYNIFNNMIVKYLPDAVAIEEPVFSRNVKSLRIQSYLIGYLMNSPYSICLMNNKTIKKLFTGNGNADKKEMIETAKTLFDIKSITEDEADAIAIAYSYIKDHLKVNK